MDQPICTNNLSRVLEYNLFDMENIKKILVIRRDNIGDLLCTTPLFTALRRHYPDAFIAAMVNSYNAPVLKNNPDIDRVYTYTKAKHSNTFRVLAWFKEGALFLRLKKEKFDLIIHANPTVHIRTRRLVRFLNAPHQIGVDDTNRYYNMMIAIHDLPKGHHVEQVFYLLQPLGIQGTPGPLTLLPQTPFESNKPFTVGIQLSSRKIDNRWPYSHYECLIETLLAEKRRIMIFWSPGRRDNPQHPGDDDLAYSLEERFKGRITLCETKTLQQLIEKMNQVDLMVSPDGGAMHISAALRKPTVALFGCTDPKVWGPWQTECQILEGHGSAENIKVSEVVDAINNLRSITPSQAIDSIAKNHS